MVKKITLHFFLLLSLSLNAQNWQCFKTDAISHFKSSHEYIASVRIDSTFNGSDYTDFVSYYMVRYAQNAQFTSRGASWIGEKFRLMNSGENYLYNSLSEEILIKKPVLNDIYQMFRSNFNNIIITAKVDTIIEAPFLGLVDSVAQISMIATDTLGNNIVNPCNNYIIRSSKNYGLIAALNFYAFPFLIYPEFNEYPTDTLNLIGLDNPQVGWQNFGSKEIYDWEVGDEFHSLYNTQPAIGPNPGARIERQLIRKIINKTIFNDSVHYQIERCFFEKIDNYSTNYHNQIKVFDTIIEKYAFVTNLNYLPFEIYQEDFTKFNVKNDSTIITDTQWDINIIENHEGNQVVASWSRKFTGTKGIGRSFYWYDWGGDEFENFVYYKKENLEWGIPYNCANLSISSIQNNKFKVYPNPTRDKIYFEFPTNHSQILNFSITDLSGKELLHHSIHDKLSEIDLSPFENGIYMLNFETENQNYFYKISKY